ncbi:MAG: hypothetical protein IAE82_16305 [Opitutaceae bacterium]|nr:hypothetical protein [Opitutaceae bacterium]
MKTEVSRPIATFWQALSEVPGWPDAPLTVRLRRLWPLVLPLVGCVALVAWTGLVREPARRETRAAHAELLALEQETEELRQTLSDQTAAELAAQAAAAQALLMDSPTALQDRLKAYAVQAREAGWEATFQIYGLAEDDAAAGEGARFVFVPARVRLEPRTDSADRFATLVATLGRLASLPGRIEITRVTVRADRPGVPVVEVNLRAACRPAHEKAAE